MAKQLRKSRAFCGVLAAVLVAGSTISVGAEPIETQVAVNQSTIANLESMKSDAEAYLTELSTQLTTLTSELDDLQQQYNQTAEDIQIAQIEYEAAEKKSEKQSEDMKQRIQFMYENGANANIVSSLFSANSFMEFLNRAEFVSSVDRYDRNKLAEFQETQKEIATKKAALQEQQNEIATLQEESKQKQAELQNLYESTSAQVAMYAASLWDAQSYQAQLLASVQAQASAAGAYFEQDGMEYTGEYNVSDSQVGAAAGTANIQTPVASTNAGYPNYSSGNSSWTGSVLNKRNGMVTGPSGTETYYNLPMSGVVQIMRDAGYNEEFWVRDDGVKMYGNYVMLAADQSIRPLGSLCETSLGTGIVCDTGDFIYSNPTQVDIAVSW